MGVPETVRFLESYYFLSFVHFYLMKEKNVSNLECTAIKTPQWFQQMPCRRDILADHRMDKQQTSHKDP